MSTRLLVPCSAASLRAAIAELYSWDDIENSSDGTLITYKKYYNGEDYVGFRLGTSDSLSSFPFYLIRSRNEIIKTVQISFTYTPSNGAVVSNGSVLGLNLTSVNYYPTGYTSSSAYHWYMCIAPCTNIISGDTGYCVFGGYVDSGSPSWLSMNSGTTGMPSGLQTNALIGAAYSPHDIHSGDVANGVLTLAALPDNMYSCMYPAIFNGGSYTRLSHLLIPS